MTKIISNDVRSQVLRLIELKDRLDRKYGRLSLVYEDMGHVEDVNGFLSGCMSNMPVVMTFDGSGAEWELLCGHRQLKTLIDFVEGRIEYDGMKFEEIEGYLRSRITWLKIHAFVINPTYDDKEEQRNFLKFK